MATYTIEGHPLDYSDFPLTQAQLDAIRSAPTGATITITLSGPHDTKVKGHKFLK